MKVFVSPHCDDETLFGAFTIIREKPLVVIVYDGYVQGLRGVNVTAQQRRAESEAAVHILGAPMISFLGFHDDDSTVTAIRIAERMHKFIIQAEEVYAPAWEEDGHAQHNLVSDACLSARHYTTYTRNGGRTLSDKPVKIENGNWIALKHRALACYQSQMDLDIRLGCWSHFVRDITEYMR